MIAMNPILPPVENGAASIVVVDGANDKRRQLDACRAAIFECHAYIGTMQKKADELGEFIALCEAQVCALAKRRGDIEGGHV